MSVQTIEIADGVITIRSEVDESELRRNARRAGDDYEREFNRAIRDRADGDQSMLRRVFSGIGESIRGGLTTVLTGVLPALGAVTNGLLAFGPIVVQAAIAVGQVGAAALAAAPALLSLGASFKIAMLVIQGFGPTLLKAVSPITDSLKKAEESAANLAARGIRPLAQEFVKMNMPAISRMMDEIARSTNGVVRGYLEWANSARGVSTIGKITQGVSDLVGNLSTRVLAVAISFTEMLGRISGVATAAGSAGLTKVLRGVKEVLDGITAKTVSDGLTTLGETFRSIQKFGQDTWTVISTLWSWYQKWHTEIGLVSDALGILAIVFGGPVTAIIAAIGLVIRHFDTFKALLLGAQGWFGGIEGGAGILERLKGAAILVWEALQRAFFTIRDAVSGPLSQLWTVIQQQLLPALGNFYIALAPIVAALIDFLAPAIGMVIGFLVQYVTGLVIAISKGLEFLTWLMGLGPQIQAIFTAVVGFFQALPGRIGAALAALPGQIEALFKFVADKMLFATGYMIGATIKFFIDLPGRARAAVASLWSSISGAFSSAKSGATTSASNMVTSTVEYFKGLPGKAKSAIASLPGQIKSVFSGAGSWLYSAGADILRGLVNGMKGAVGAAVNAAIGAAQSVISGLKRGLGIASPSKVAEEEVGAYVMPGVAKGITKSVPEFQKDIQGVAPVAATSAVAATAAAASTTSGGGGLQIGNLTLQLKGLLDPNDPTSWRRMIAQLYDALHNYEKSYA